MGSVEIRINFKLSPRTLKKLRHASFERSKTQLRVSTSQTQHDGIKATQKFFQNSFLVYPYCQWSVIDDFESSAK